MSIENVLSAKIKLRSGDCIIIDNGTVTHSDAKEIKVGQCIDPRIFSVGKPRSAMLEAPQQRKHTGAERNNNLLALSS